MTTHSGTCLTPGRSLEGTLPHKLLRGERGLPCTAGSQSSGDLCRHYSSSHTLEGNRNEFRAALAGVLTLHLGPTSCGKASLISLTEHSAGELWNSFKSRVF